MLAQNVARQSSNRNYRSIKDCHNDTRRLNIILFKLKALSDALNKQYREAHLAGKTGELEEINARFPIQLINKALASASLPVEVDWNIREELVTKRMGCAGEYLISKMSDGERASLILAGEAILADKDGIILIDEPDRHLHRSISSPLLRCLRNMRPDLRWVIATHDLSLPRDDPEGKLLLLYEFRDDRWRADLLNDSMAVPDKIADAIYGARQRVLFVEGEEESLDRRIYHEVFRRVTIVPAGNCRNVCDSVVGLKAVPQLHHMDAFGLVDGDDRVDADKLKTKKVFVLKVYSVESVYYHPSVIEEMVNLSAEKTTLEDVIDAAVSAMGNCNHLAEKTAYRRYRDEYLGNMLDIDAFTSSVSASVPVDGPGLVEKTCKELEQLKKDRNWSEIVRRFSIKKSGARDAVARKLGFDGSARYENALLKSLADGKISDDVIFAIIPDPFAPSSPVVEAA